MSNESWTKYTLKFIGWIILRAAADHMLSGLRTALNFAAVAKNFYDGDMVRGVINLLYGVLCLFTFAALTTVKDVAGQSVKEACEYGFKRIFPTAERKATNAIGKDLAARDFVEGIVNEGEFFGDVRTTFTRVVSVSYEGVLEVFESFSMTRRYRRA